MPLTIHLGHELAADELVELLVAPAAGHFGGKPAWVGENLVHVGITADNDLGRAIVQHVERWPPGPLREMLARVRFEVGAAEVNLRRIAEIESSQRNVHRELAYAVPANPNASSKA